MYKILFILCVSLCCLGCNKKAVTSNGTNATIIGFSGDKCACCWGYKIVIDNDPTVIPAIYVTRGYWLADNIPGGYAIPYDADFPIRVYVEWEFDNTRCPYTYIRLLKLTFPVDRIKK